MTEERDAIRLKHEKNLESSMRFGDWSLDKYSDNAGYVVYHRKCGYWTHTFYNNTRNSCAHCEDPPALFPLALENVYRIANFDLMHTNLWNSSIDITDD